MEFVPVLLMFLLFVLNVPIALAIAMAALVVAEQDPSALLLVMPSDHRIGDLQAFHQAVERGSRA
ncbi:MAG: hypothetical protein ACLGHY_08855, partial [Gammaproteobacteria bacterium]